MDIKTIFCALALGNFIFGVVLILYQYRENSSQVNPFWTTAKFLQCAAWILLALRDLVPDSLSIILANICLLSGIAYECWTVYEISGKPVNRILHISTLVSISIIWILVSPLPVSIRITFFSSIAAIFFALSGRVMLKQYGERSILRSYLGWNMWLMTTILLARGFLALIAPEGFTLFSRNISNLATFSAFYYMMFVNGFGLLQLTKEITDRELQAILKEQKAILNTLPTGLCILRDRVIEQCNPAMEAMFGFASGTLAGRSVRCLYENDELFEEYGRSIYAEIKQKGRFDGEVAYIRQNGEQFWARDLGTSIFEERPQAYSVVSVTDISKQKKQHEMLTLQKEELEATLARIKRLEGIISICMYCKKIRNEESWDQLEKYITEHSDAFFSHGICPECLEKELKSMN